MEGECGTPHEHELLEERAAAEKHHTPANVHVAVRAPAGPPAPAFDGSSGDGGGLLATDAASETHRDAMVIAHSLSVAAMSPSPVKRSADLRQQNLLQDAAHETEKPEAAVIELTDDPEARARLCTLLASSNYQDTPSQQAATSLLDTLRAHEAHHCRCDRWPPARLHERVAALSGVDESKRKCHRITAARRR